MASWYVIYERDVHGVAVEVVGGATAWRTQRLRLVSLVTHLPTLAGKCILSCMRKYKHGKLVNVRIASAGLCEGPHRVLKRVGGLAPCITILQVLQHCSPTQSVSSNMSLA